MANLMESCELAGIVYKKISSSGRNRGGFSRRILTKCVERKTEPTHYQQYPGQPDRPWGSGLCF